MNQVRSGIGFDVHRFVAGRPLVLGGVAIPHDKGLEGHSDADVLLHAIADALLGAAALGDIGHHFPDDDPRWAGVDSREILTSVLERVTAAGWRIGNVDATVLAEAPRVAPHLDAILESIASTLSLAPDQINVKATTMETMGFIGREEGMGTIAIATLVRKDGG